MTNEGPPCSHELGVDCFEEQPAWAKQAFAYRLLMLVTPKPLARRLHRRLFRFILPPGIDFPPGVDLPPGTLIPPGVEPPTIYEPGDPIPPGVTGPVGTVFPPGWTPEDPPPPGVVVPPGVVIPPGWTPPGPLPPGTIPPGKLPPGTGPNGTTPPLFIPPWEPGPPRRPPRAGGGVTIATTTVYGSTSDGCMRKIDTVWATARGAAVGEDLNDSASTYMPVASSLLAAPNYHIWRGWLFMDLSTVPVGATITACILKMTSYDEAESIMTVVQGTQADPLSTADYNNFTGAEFGHVTWALGGGGVPAPNQITFNATGLAYLTTVIGGTAKLCLREYTYDYLNAAPAAGPPYFRMGMWFQETATVANRPHLHLTYQH